MTLIQLLVKYFSLLTSNDYEVLCNVSFNTETGVDYRHISVTCVETTGNDNLLVSVYDDDNRRAGEIFMRKDQVEDRILILDPSCETIELEYLETEIKESLLPYDVALNC